MIIIFRCVKAGYTVRAGTYQPIWNDRGSGADEDVSLWAKSSAGSYIGLDANTFKALTYYSQPHDTPFLLNSQYTKSEHGRKTKM